MRPPDRPGAARGPAVGGPLHRLPADRGPRRMSRRRRAGDADADGAAGHDRRRPGGRRDAPRRSRSGRRSSRSAGRTRRRFLKAESLQPIGAFKIRGAYVAVAVADRRGARAAASITYSSGNHAQGVARAARLLGAPRGGRHAVRRAGAEAGPGRGRRRRGRRRRDRRARSASRSPSEIAAERGLAIIPPYDDDRIIAGQGTVGLEIVEDAAGRRRRPRPDRRRRAGERRRGRDPGARSRARG